MFILGQDDGTNIGPFKTLDEALLCDIQAMAAYSVTAYQTRAQRLLRLATPWDELTETGLEAWRDAASKLVDDVDHVIFEVILHVGSNQALTLDDPAELYKDLVFDENLSEPKDYIDGAITMAEAAWERQEEKRFERD
jgi:hypothetical protein